MLARAFRMQIIQKEGKNIFKTIFIIIFSILSLVSNSNADAGLEVKTQARAAEIKEASIVENTAAKSTESDDFCMADSFKGVINWFAEKLEFIDEQYLRNSDHDEIKEPLIEPLIETSVIKESSAIKESNDSIQPLDLTIPDEEHGGMMEMGSDTALQLPDLFADPKDQPFTKEKPGASFGGRILMDDAEIDGMQEYRFEDVRDAVRGAEVSLEFKTN